MNTDKIIDAFKQASKNKTATLQDHIVYSIARAYKHAKSEGEANYLTTMYVLRSVSPLSQKRAASETASGDRYRALTHALFMLKMRFEGRLAPYGIYQMVAQEHHQIFLEAIKRLQGALSRHYVYIFVRQDIIPEQQAVQAAHATMMAGAHLAGKSFGGKRFDPNTTHFVLIGVPNLDELWNAYDLAENSAIRAHMFLEEDMGDEATAFCTDVVLHDKRKVFREYGLLKFRQPHKTFTQKLKELF